MFFRSGVIAPLLHTVVIPTARAQFVQQGNELVGPGSQITGASEGTAVAVAADGNTSIVGGPGDNSGIGAAWIFVRSNGVWTEQGAKLVANVATLFFGSL